MQTKPLFPWTLEDFMAIRRKANLGYVYGFQRNGEWLYIGSSVQPDKRRWRLEFDHPELKQAQFKIIRSAPIPDLSRLETQVIRAVRRRQQGRFNIRDVGTRNSIRWNPILWIEHQWIFSCPREVALAFDIPESSIRSRVCKRKGAPFRLSSPYVGWVNGVTLVEIRRMRTVGTGNAE